MTPFLPMDPEALSVSLKHFGKVGALVSTLVGTIVVARFTLNLILFGSSESYGTVLRDAVTFFVSIALFPSIARSYFEIVGALSTSISLSVVQPTDTVSSILDSISILPVPRALREMGALYLARHVYTILISVLIALGPVAILQAVLLQGGSIGAYLGALATLSLWPLAWNLIGSLGTEIGSSYVGSVLDRVVYEIVIQVIQMFSPLISVVLFRSFGVGEVIRAPMRAIAAAKSAGGTLAATAIQKRGKK